MLNYELTLIISRVLVFAVMMYIWDICSRQCFLHDGGKWLFWFIPTAFSFFAALYIAVQLFLLVF